jgi:hypothetical protein
MSDEPISHELFYLADEFAIATFLVDWVVTRFFTWQRCTGITEQNQLVARS